MNIIIKYKRSEGAALHVRDIVVPEGSEDYWLTRPYCQIINGELIWLLTHSEQPEFLEDQTAAALLAWSCVPYEERAKKTVALNKQARESRRQAQYATMPVPMRLAVAVKSFVDGHDHSDLAEMPIRLLREAAEWIENHVR